VSSSSPQRLIFVDVLRSLAIGLAIAAHAFNDFEVSSRLADHEYILSRLLTRTATPSFIFMFGMMLELAYVRKLERSGFAGTVPRLLWRSLQCYFGYVLTVAAGWAAGMYDGVHALQSAFFIFGVRHGNILQFYTVALVVAIPLLALRRRFGILATVGVCIGLWVLDPLFNALNAIHVGRFGGIQTLMTQMIPSSLTFIGAGMFMGQVLRFDRRRLARALHLRAGLILAAGLAVVAVLVWSSSAGTVLHSYLDFYAYRSSYHIGYYAIGLLQAVGLCLILFHAFPPQVQRPSPSSPLLCFGRCSLLSFTLGNILLTFMMGIVPDTPYLGMLWAGALLVGLFVLVNAQEQLLRYLRAHARLRRAFYPATLMQEHLIAPLSSALVTRGRLVSRRLLDARKVAP
jgi:hypothetical protein